MPAFSRFIPLALTFLTGYSLLLFFMPVSVHAAGCTNAFTSTVSVPTGYGAAYNLFSPGKELLLQGTDCTATSFAIKAGSEEASQYIYKQGYSWSGTSWVPLNLTGTTPLQGNSWYTGQATASVTPTNNTAYVVTYTCQQVSGAWKCGCRDTTCASPAWRLQSISAGGSAVQCGNNVCEASESTQSCPADCKAAGNADIIINYASAANLGSQKHVAAGFLHGLPGSAITPASLYTDLNVKLLRSRPETILQFATLDKNMRGGSTDITMVATLSGNWGYPNNGKSAPWINMSSWTDYVTKEVNRLTAAIPADRLIIDFWNEPNNSQYWGAWGDPDFTHFKEVYRVTYNLVKSLAPNVRMTAPGSSLGLDHLGRDTFTTDFMKYAKDNNVVPDIWNWHFGDPQTIREFNRIMDYGQSIGAPRDGMILEYAREQDGKRPGRLIYEMALIDSAVHAATGKRLIGAAQAQWPTTGYLGNAIFDSGGWKKKGDWYAYADYAKMQGNQAIFTSVTTPKIGAAASIDTSSKQAWALLGNDVIDQRTNPNDGATIPATTIRLDGIKSGDASGKVNVTVSRIPYKNFGEVTDADITKVINDTQYTVTNNSISVAIPWGLAVDGYFVEISNVSPN